MEQQSTQLLASQPQPGETEKEVTEVAEVVDQVDEEVDNAVDEEVGNVVDEEAVVEQEETAKLE